jgi:hypothetical protein
MHYVQIVPLYVVEVFLSQIAMLNYLMEIHHHGWTFWFKNEKTNRTSANMSFIINHLVAIFQIFNQMSIIVRKTRRLV